jgi:hypothetical protein
MKRISARALFGAALALFLAWVAALTVLAVVSSTRPGDIPRRQPPVARPQVLDRDAATD